jgi:hypothetical protein
MRAPNLLCPELAKPSLLTWATSFTDCLSMAVFAARPPFRLHFRTDHAKMEAPDFKSGEAGLQAREKKRRNLKGFSLGMIISICRLWY